MKFLTLLFSLLFLFQSCSSSKRVKERPDFTLTGAAATNEIEKFRLEHVSLAHGKFADEDVLTFAENKKLKPFMKEISPKSVEMLESTRPKELIYWAIFASWFSTIFIKNADGKRSSLYWVGFGATIGYGLYLDSERAKVVDKFNEDLKAKFTPTVGYNFSF